MNRFITCFLALIVCCNTAFSQQSAKTTVKRMPPDGITIPDNDRLELETGLQRLDKAISALKQRHDKFVTNLLPDVEIYYKAIDYALKYQEFFAPKEIIAGKKILQDGLQRATDLAAKKAPWTTQKGEVVRGYVSKIDKSVQPYAVFVPDNYTGDGKAFNLSLWFHGRGETLSEVGFISGGKGFFPNMPEMKNTIMLYPYGRYCNAFKFAGEVDVLEAMADVQKNYRVNNDGIIDRGFSMGGAAAWQFAVHYSDLFLAANPGAGFSDTYDFMKVTSKQELHPTWYERKLWHFYDCVDYASNVSNLPLYAYNGDKDPQKEAADIMEIAMKKEGLNLNRVWGLNMGHGYTKAAAITVDSILANVAAKGKNPPPTDVHLTTYTLKYNRLHWLRADGLGEHWNQARIDGNIKNNTIRIFTNNVTAFSINPSLTGLAKHYQVDVSINHSTIIINKFNTIGILCFHLVGTEWVRGPATEKLIKRHNLQGPVDDAFMSAFIVVKPSGTSSNSLFDQWSKAEMDRFIIQWRRQFRGDPIVKTDKEITTADMTSNLILFGDAESNSIIAKLNGKLPIIWTADHIQAGPNTYSSKDHGLIMVYPNPLNQKHYVVLNSGFTFRDDAFLNNSKQIPMLPDWAVIDLNTPPDAIHPGKVTEAGFFGEHWELKEPVKE